MKKLSVYAQFEKVLCHFITTRGHTVFVPDSLSISYRKISAAGLEEKSSVHIIFAEQI
jgi:hypothetical protein